MKTGILYGSCHGRTRKVVEHVRARLAVEVDVHDAKEVADPAALAMYDILFVFCPTYGDEELQPDIESFLLRFDTRLDGRLFTVCELGNYYGYDDYTFGALRIIRSHWVALGARELCGPLSLDSLPQVPWGHLDRWIARCNEALGQHVGH